MQPNSLCFFNSNRAWGGGEKWHFETACLAREAGYRVSFVAGAGSALAARLKDLEGVSVLTLPLGNLSFLSPPTLLRLARFFREEHTDAVLLCLPADVKSGGIAARLAGVPDIIYRRGIAAPVRDRLLNRLLFRRVLTKLIVNSRSTLDCVLAENPDLIPPERVHLVHNGFDVQGFDALPACELVQRRPGELLIGNAARLTPQKGQHLLLEAAAILKRQPLPFRVLIAGSGESEQELKRHARELGVEDVVEFLGFVQDMKSFHASADIFALPSLWEGFCYALVEAMTLCRPVVAWNASSNPEVVADGETGFLCPAGDVAAFAARLLELMRDPGLRERMGQAGRRRVLERFERRKAFAELERCLRA